VSLKPISQLNQRPRLPAVVREAGAFEFYVEGRMVYDFEALAPGDALRWIEHLAGKPWVTTQHLREFARLAAEHFGQGHR